MFCYRHFFRGWLAVSLVAAACGQTNMAPVKPVKPLVANPELKKLTPAISDGPPLKGPVPSTAGPASVERFPERPNQALDAIPQTALSPRGRELRQVGTHIDLTTQKAQLDEFRRADRPLYLTRPEIASKPPTRFGRLLSGLFSAATAHMQPIGPAQVAPDGKVQ